MKQPTLVQLWIKLIDTVNQNKIFLKALLTKLTDNFPLRKCSLWAPDHLVKHSAMSFPRICDRNPGRILLQSESSLKPMIELNLNVSNTKNKKRWSTMSEINGKHDNCINFLNFTIRRQKGILDILTRRFTSTYDRYSASFDYPVTTEE